MSWSPWAVIVGLIAALVSLLLAGVSQIPISVRITLIIVTVVVAAIVWVVLVLSKRGLVMWRRARFFDSHRILLSQANSRLLQRDDELVKLSAFVSFLLQALEDSGAASFKVAGAIKRKGSAVLILSTASSNPKGKKLMVGDRVVVANDESWAMLGIFEVLEQDSRGRSYAREANILDAVWWGKVHLDLTPHESVHVHAVALLVVGRGER